MRLPITQYRLLVVDDDQTIVTLLLTALEHVGYEVNTAACGEEALRKLAEKPVDLVLLDINLPDLSGIEVMRRIIKTTSASVILITGGDADYTHEMASREGAADFIVKPIRLPDLDLRIRRALELRRMKEVV